MKRLISLILAFVLIFSFSVSSFAANDVYSSDLKSGWSVSGTSVSNPTGYTSSWFTNVLKFLSLIGHSSDNSGSSSIYGRLVGIENNTAVLGRSSDSRSSLSIMGKLIKLNYDFDNFVTSWGLFRTFLNGRLDTNLSALNTHLNGIDSSADSIEIDIQTIVDKIGNSFTSGSVLYFLSNILSTDNGIHSDTSALLPLVQRIRDMVGDDDDYRRKQESENNNQAFEDNFLSGDNSVSTSNIGALSGLGTSFKQFFSMTGAGGGSAEVDISAWSDILVDDEPFTFFTEADTIAEAMGVQSGGYIPNPDIPDDPPAPTYSSYIVHYYLQGTTQSLADDKIVNDVEVGTSVTETAPSITGYDLVGDNSQTFTIFLSGNVITFYYVLHIDYANYTVYYYAENTTTQLATPKFVTNVVVGSQVTENAIPITDYTLVGDTSQTITIALSGNVITFYYRLNDTPEPEPQYASYTVHYYKQGTTVSVRNDKTVDNVEVGTSVTETAPTISGYTLVGDSSQTFTIIITGNVITFYYIPVVVYSSYTVHYYKTGTTTSVKTDKIVNNVEVGTSVTETAPSVSGYSLNGSSSQTITIIDGSNVIIFYYNEIIRHTLTYSGSGTYSVQIDGSSVSSGYTLNDGDVIDAKVRVGIASNGVTVNGTFYSTNTSIDIYNSDIILSFSGSSSGSVYRHIYITYHSSPAPLRMLRSAPADTSNTVVTHYYADNLNKLFGFLRGD